MAKEKLEIHQTRRFRKALDAMGRADKSARDAAARAAKIIADLQSDPCHHEAELKRTRHGELRLQQCRKYDLACGHRLIALKRHGRLVFVYIGSHDDCQRWIDNNRDNLEEIDSEPVQLSGRPAAEQGQGDADGHEVEVEAYEREFMARLDEGMLREVFDGLCGKDHRDHSP